MEEHVRRPLQSGAYGQDRFLVDDRDDFRIRVERDASGKVVRVVIFFPGGEQVHARG